MQENNSLPINNISGNIPSVPEKVSPDSRSKRTYSNLPGKKRRRGRASNTAFTEPALREELKRLQRLHASDQGEILVMQKRSELAELTVKQFTLEAQDLLVKFAGYAKVLETILYKHSDSLNEEVRDAFDVAKKVRPIYLDRVLQSLWEEK